MNALRAIAGLLAFAATLGCEERLPPPDAPAGLATRGDYRLPARRRCREPRIDAELRVAAEAARAVADALRGSPFACVGDAVSLDSDRRVRFVVRTRCEAGDVTVLGEATIELTVGDGLGDAGIGACAALETSALRVATRPRSDERSRPIDPSSWLRREAPPLEGMATP